MKKIWFALILLVLALGLFSACTSRLPDGFDELEVKDHAAEIVELISAQQYQEVEDRLRDDLKEVLSAGVLEENVHAFIGNLGAYKEISKIALSGTSDSNTKEAYAVAVVITAYENGSAQFTISFNQDFELVGLYLK